MSQNKKILIAYILFTIALFVFGNTLIKIIPSEEVVVLGYVAFTIYSLYKYKHDKEIAILFVLMIIIFLIFSNTDTIELIKLLPQNIYISFSFWLYTTYISFSLYIFIVIPIKFILSLLFKSKTYSEDRNNLLKEQNELLRKQNELLSQNLQNKIEE